MRVIIGTFLSAWLGYFTLLVLLRSAYTSLDFSAALLVLALCVMAAIACGRLARHQSRLRRRHLHRVRGGSADHRARLTADPCARQPQLPFMMLVYVGLSCYSYVRFGGRNWWNVGRSGRYRRLARVPLRAP